MLDFFFLVLVVVVAAEEVAGAGAALDCCGVNGVGTRFAADAEHAYTRDARTNDALIGSLLIFLRMSPLPRVMGSSERSVWRELLTLL